MKSKLLFAILLMVFTASIGFASEAHSADDSLLYHVQEKIHDAFYNSFRTRSAAKLIAIEKKLKTIKGNNRIVQYWKAYTLYDEAIYFLQTGNKRTSRKTINDGIDILKNIKPKRSDDYALLALMQGFSIQFSGGLGSAVLGENATKNAQKAVKLNKENVRAWYVRGLLNYRTPKQFGGGTIVEKCLKKAITLKGKNRNNPYLPTWGKARSYGLLVSYYIKNNHIPDAIKVLKEGLKKYPGNHILKQDAKKLENK